MTYSNPKVTVANETSTNISSNDGLAMYKTAHSAVYNGKALVTYHSGACTTSKKQTYCLFSYKLLCTKIGKMAVLYLSYRLQMDICDRGLLKATVTV